MGLLFYLTNSLFSLEILTWIGSNANGQLYNSVFPSVSIPQFGDSFPYKIVHAVSPTSISCVLIG